MKTGKLLAILKNNVESVIPKSSRNLIEDAEKKFSMTSESESMIMKVWIVLLFIGIACLVSAGNSKNDELNTAANVNYLTAIEKEIVYEINRFRSNPSEYSVEYLVPLTEYYDKKVFHYPNDKPIVTKEGVRALKECIRNLRDASPLPIIYPSLGLTRAANDHVKDQGKSGKTGHKGGDYSSSKDRIERYGNWNISIAENISYGGVTPRQILIFLLIDDGVRDRGHRKTLLNPDFKTVGVAFGKHPVYETMCVMDFAGAFTEK